MKSIAQQIRDREITRVFHFTRFDLFSKILDDRYVWSREQLEKSVNSIEFNDAERFDNHRAYISTSIQFPNVYLLDKFRKRSPQRSWLLMEFSPTLLTWSTTKFSPCNAAFQNGKHVVAGPDGFNNLFVATAVPGKQVLDPIASCPCNIQAEALIHRALNLRHLRRIVTRTAREAEAVMEELVARDLKVPVVVGENFFDQRAVLAEARGQAVLSYQELATGAHQDG